jgi:hypothetical protein
VPEQDGPNRSERQLEHAATWATRREAEQDERRAARAAARRKVRLNRHHGIGRAELEEEPPPEASPPRVIPQAEKSALETLISERLGRPIRYISGEEVAREKGARRKRRYVRHTLQFIDAAGGDIVVFAKVALRRPLHVIEPLETFLSELSLPEFRAPKYFGSIDTEEGPAGVWEHISGHANKFLGHFSRDDLLRMVRACAAMSAITDERLFAIPSIPRGMKQIAPVAERLRGSVNKLGTVHEIDIAPLLAGVDRLAAIEHQAIERFNALGNRYFSHQDIGSGNIIFPPEPEPAIVIDWESAYFGAPGASLRRISNLKMPVQEEMVRHYVDAMAAKGFVLNERDVMFVMGAAQVFFTLTWAIRRLRERPYKAERAIRWGLRHCVDYLVR